MNSHQLFVDNSLQGRWLERAGFNAGNKITVDCQQGRLIIKNLNETAI
ncbi:SymE family type I addiction module toxin [uncultured Acetatifactor sp.]|nr:SymE family type I addiction module toxin [uncultured Acetatifactor sp.]